MNEALKFVFKSNDNKSRMLSIYNPKVGLDDITVNDAMDTVIKSGVLQTSDGAMVSLKSQAYLESKTKKNFNLDNVRA